MARSDEDKKADNALSIQLLAGFDIATGAQVNLAHNSAAELKARAALARIVREKMNGFSGELLALAIDPTTPSPWHVPATADSPARGDMRAARKIKFERPGRRSTLMRDKRVVDFIRRMRFNSTQKHHMKFYLNTAADKFGLKYSNVHAIWNAYEKMIEQAGKTDSKK